MSISSTALAVAQSYWHIALSSIVFAYFLANRFQKGLHKIPGPWLNSISTLPRMWSVYKGNQHTDDLRMHGKYGKIVRLAPNLVSVADVGEINQIYGITTKFTKSPFYDLASVHDEEGLVPDTFVIRNDKALHSRMKRNAANAYSMNGLIKFEGWIDSVMGRLLPILDGNAKSETIIDMGDLVKRFAMDAITTLTFGRDFQYLEKGDHLKFFDPLDLFTVYMAIFGHVAWLHPYLLGHPRIAEYMTRGDNSADAMLKIASQEMENTRANPPKEETMTFLAQLNQTQAANPKLITDREMITHAFGNLSAGSDTTGTAMRAVIYYLLQNPKAYARLATEIRENLRLPVSFNKAYELDYLRAVIQEAMRLHPSVGQILGRTIPSGGATIGGYYMAAGAEVGISPWVLHRDPEVFPDPDSFVPERWILKKGSVSEENLRDMNRSFFAFGHGAHTCSGRHISMMETTKLIATLFLRYDMEYVKVGEGYRFSNRWFTPQEGLNIRLKLL